MTPRTTLQRASRLRTVEQRRRRSLHLNNGVGSSTRRGDHLSSGVSAEEVGITAGHVEELAAGVVRTFTRLLHPLAPGKVINPTLPVRENGSRLINGVAFGMPVP